MVGRPKTMARRAPLSLPPDFAKRVAAFRFANMFTTESDALRFLIELGLESAQSMPRAELVRRMVKAGSVLDAEDEPKKTGKR